MPWNGPASPFHSWTQTRDQRHATGPDQQSHAMLLQTSQILQYGVYLLGTRVLHGTGTRGRQRATIPVPWNKTISIPVPSTEYAIIPYDGIAIPVQYTSILQQQAWSQNKNVEIHGNAWSSMQPVALPTRYSSYCNSIAIGSWYRYLLSTYDTGRRYRQSRVHSVLECTGIIHTYSVPSRYCRDWPATGNNIVACYCNTGTGIDNIAIPVVASMLLFLYFYYDTFLLKFFKIKIF